MALTRRETVVALLETRNDVILPEREGVVGSGPESRVLELSPLYKKGSYAELDRCLALMIERSPKIYQHVRERYLNKQSRVIEVPYRKHTKGLILKLPPHTAQDGLPTTVDGKTARVRVVQWSAWVRLRKVDLGVEWLCKTMRDPVQLPRELLEVLAA